MGGGGKAWTRLATTLSGGGTRLSERERSDESSLSVGDGAGFSARSSNEGGGGSVGFSRKSVSFCQRDNVHVYKSEPYYEDEDDIVDLASLSSKCCSVAN